MFVPEELRLFVEFEPRGSEGGDWISFEDLLARVPRDETQKAALERLVALISDALKRE